MRGRTTPANEHSHKRLETVKALTKWESSRRLASLGQFDAYEKHSQPRAAGRR